MEPFLTFISENFTELLSLIGEHLLMVAVAMLVAVPTGIAIGIMLSRDRFRSVRAPLFYLIGLGQTVPSLAIIALAVGVIGVGMIPAIVAILLYALLPIARNSYTGIAGVDASVVDAAHGMGMTPRQVLHRVEIPLAAPLILAGVRTSTVFAVSTAALASLIGGGGLGEFIFGGIALFKPEMMLAGAIPTALLALGADWGLGRIASRSPGQDPRG
jgi:osmoprotectant transport system permease protein